MSVVCVVSLINGVFPSLDIQINKMPKDMKLFGK